MTQKLSYQESAGGGLVARVFGVARHRETYRSLAYLLVRFPLGVAYFTTFVTGLTLGVALLPLVVGAPILAAVLGAASYVGAVETALLRRLLGRRVSYDPVTPGDLALTAYLRAAATEPGNYLLVALALGSFAVGLLLFVAVVAGLTLGLTLVAAPVLYGLPGVEYRLTTSPAPVELGPVTVDAGTLGGLQVTTLPEALLASLAGVVVLLVGLHLVTPTARRLAGITETLVRVADGDDRSRAHEGE